MLLTVGPPAGTSSAAMIGAAGANSTAHTNAAARDGHWHSLKVEPDPRLPSIHFHNKLNPVWWLENADEPAPPAWYLPADKHRVTKWRFRNPFHNFDFYIIGVVDKSFVRSGRYPERNSSPHGGWDFDLDRRKLLLLPFISFEKPWCTFYFGWREHGAFGAELRFHHKTSDSASNKIPR
jgi:hypothetical protein